MVSVDVEFALWMNRSVDLLKYYLALRSSAKLRAAAVLFSQGRTVRTTAQAIEDVKAGQRSVGVLSSMTSLKEACGLRW